MHKIIISVFLLFSFNAQCASWADIAKGKARKPAAPVVQLKTMPAIEIHKPLPTNEPAIQQPTIPPHVMLLRQGCDALAAKSKATAVAQIVQPILSMHVDPYIKSLAYHLTAQAYAKEKNTQAELINLCNELGVSYNEDKLVPYLVPYNERRLFPEYNLTAVHRLCELFATGHFTAFKNICQDDELPHKFAELIMHSGHLSGSIHATHLLAQSAEQSGDYARAVELYDMLPHAYAQPLLADIAAAKLSHIGTSEPQTTAQILESVSNPTLLAKVIKKLTANNSIDALIAVKQHEFKTTKGAEKFNAAFELSSLLRDTNPHQADIYLGLAITGGNQAACKDAYSRGIAERDEQQAIKLLEMAANGGHVAAQLKCGSYYREKALRQTTEKADSTAYLNKARSFFDKAAAQDSPRAYIEIATLAEDIPSILKLLNALANTKTFPLRAEAFQKIGEVYLRSSRHFAKEPKLTAERDKHIDYAEKAFRQAAALKYPDANISCAESLLEKAFYTTTPKIRASSLEQAEKLLKAEMRTDKNRAVAAAHLGKLYTLKNNTVTAADHFIRAFKIAPGNTDCFDILAETFNAMRTNKKYANIKSLATEIIKLLPDCAHAHAALGFVYVEHEHNLPAARASYKLAGQLGYALGYENLAITYHDAQYNNQNHSKALKYFLIAQKMEPSHTEHLILIANCYLSLARHAEAIAILQKGVTHNCPDCMITLADCHHKGYTGDHGLEYAAELYSRAAKMYKNKNTALTHFCETMHFIITRKQRNFLPGTPGDMTWLYAFDKLILELNNLAGIQNLPTSMIDEIHNTLAIQHMRHARSSNDPSTIKNACFAALAEIKKIKEKSPSALYLQSHALSVLHQHNLLDKTVTQEARYLEKMPTIYTNLINILETHRANSTMLNETYNRYAIYLEQTLQHEQAILFYKKAAVHGSISAAINLFDYYLKINNEKAAATWFDHIKQWVESQPYLDPASPITQRLLTLTLPSKASTSQPRQQQAHNNSHPTTPI